MTDIDLKFKHVLMFDGISGHAGRICDVGIKKQRIALIGNLSDVCAKKIIDCEGLCMIPGMIDVHTHSDLNYFVNPTRSMAIQQGVTTEICSACGIGIIPLKGDLLKSYHKSMSSILGELPEGLNAIDLNHFLDCLPATSTNVAFQIAHSPLRIAATDGQHVGYLSEEMRKRIEALEREAFEQGCVSISTGLGYYPALLCDTEELFLLGKIASEYGVPFTFHQRNSDSISHKYSSPLQEVINVARSSRCHVVLSHYRTFAGNCGHADEICTPIEKALGDGLRVSADFYPYEIGCTCAVSILPFSWLQNGPDFIIEQLHDDKSFITVR